MHFPFVFYSESIIAVELCDCGKNAIFLKNCPKLFAATCFGNERLFVEWRIVCVNDAQFFSRESRDRGVKEHSCLPCHANARGR